MDSESVDILEYLLKNPKADVDKAWVMEHREKFPAFFMPAVLLLKHDPQAIEDDLRQRLQKEIILSCPDRTALTDFIDPAHSGWDKFYPSAMVQSNDTDKTIDDFISTYGKSSSPAEDALLERLLFNPVPADYFAGESETYASTDSLTVPPELIPKSNATALTEEKTEPEPQPTEHTPKNTTQHHAHSHNGGEDTLLRESLAQIFIKQHRYERAFEIISKLSLNYPEKSVYFADQLRFLQKLIINQQYLDKKQ